MLQLLTKTIKTMKTNLKSQIQKLRIEDLKTASRIDKQATKKEKFAKFCNSLEYRKDRVFYKGSFLFKRMSSKMNQLNEALFFELLIINQLKTI